MIRVENLAKSFHDGERELVIIKNLTFTFPESGTVGVLGRSGVGKSTLLYLLGGLEGPSKGKIWCGQNEISKYSSEGLAEFRRKNLGFVFQSH
jgi:ABC-type lipoprotein export system ATPase subunit